MSSVRPAAPRPLNPRDIRLATVEALRARLAAGAATVARSWAEADALEREAGSIRMELLTREREAAASAGIEAELARLAARRLT